MVLRKKVTFTRTYRISITCQQTIGTPRSAERRSGAALREAGARSERNSGNCPGAQVGAQLRKRPER